MYNGGQKFSSTTVIPLTFTVKQPLETNNLTSHVDLCHFNLHTSIIMTIKVKLHPIFVK
jgi:hypothetical protein